MTFDDDPAFARRAVRRLSSIEFWERYSYYTTFALLPLFAVAPVLDGGLGWSAGQSLRFFGLYLLLVQITPILGGFLADRWLGKGMALRTGAVALLAGHGLLAVAASLPWLRLAGDERLLDVVARAGLGLADWTGGGSLPAAAATPYGLLTWCFYGAVALIAVGNGLFKPILTVVVGQLPHADERERTAAFTTFFLYINIGGLLSVLFGGWLAQRFGWSWAFGGSAIGMAVAIATTLVLDRVYLRPFLASRATPVALAPAATRSADERGALIGIVALLGLLVVCSSVSFQSYGLVSLFTAQYIARDIGGFAIPTPWFTALNPITIMALTPILLGVWRRGGIGANWTTAQHIAAALALMAAGFVPLGIAAVIAGSGVLASPAWVAVAIMLIAASELLYSPAGMAASTRLAPARFQTLAIGAQGGAIGLGAGLSGQIGAIAFEGDKAAAMAMISLVALAAALSLVFARGAFRRIGL